MASISTTSTNRVIALVDMDCFYVQVEERDDPKIKGIPAAVVQYKAYKGGGIIAVNYEARAKGVTRQMRGDDAKAVCPEIELVRVPETRGKADLTKYRDASREVINVLTEFSACVERASIDEAYIDLSEAVEKRLSEMSSDPEFVSWQESCLKSLDMEAFSTNFVLGYDATTDWFDALRESEMPSLDDIKLAIGAEIVGKMREAVYQKAGFRCSAGIAHNKVVAKFVCGMNKPNKQTVLPHSSVPILWATTKVQKVRGLGGKLGEYLVEKLGCVHMSDLNKFTEKELCTVLGTKTGQWLYQLTLGYDDEPVVPRHLPKSVGCNKNFNGPEALRTRERVKFWITNLATEVVERIQRDLEMNSRRAKTLTLHVRFDDQAPLSRSCGVNPNYNAERMAADVYAIMEKLYQTVGVLPVVSLGLIASKFEDEADVSGCTKISEFFTAKPSSSTDGNAEGNKCDMKTPTGPPKSKEEQSVPVPTPSTQSSALDKQNDKSSKPPPNESGTLSRFLQKEPETPASACEPIPLSSKALLVVPSSSTSSASTSTTSSDNQILQSTPTKTTTAGEEQPVRRKPLFVYSATVPKLGSPFKSPRKPVASSSSGCGSSSSTSNGPVNRTPLFESHKECERCGKKIKVLEYLSHLDYHFAKDLSRELNGLPAQPAAAASSSVKPKEALKRPRVGKGASSSTSKRGRPAKASSSSSRSATSTSQIRTIDSFFTKN